MLQFKSLTPFVSPSLQVIRETICPPDAFILRQFSYPDFQTPCSFLLIISASLAMFCMLSTVGRVLEVDSIPEHSNKAGNSPSSKGKLSPDPEVLGNHLSTKPPSPLSRSQIRQRRVKGSRKNNSREVLRTWRNRKVLSVSQSLPSVFLIHSYWLSSSFFRLFPEIQRYQ